MTNIILCGGSGTRLWPLSRTLMPKQFVKLFEGQSLAGRTPAPVYVRKGTPKTVMLRKQDYFDKTVTLDDSSALQVTVEMEPVPRGSIRVSTSPAGAGVYVDGVYSGKAPLVIEGVDGIIILSKAGENAILCTLAKSNASLGMVFLNIQSVSNKIADLLD